MVHAFNALGKDVINMRTLWPKLNYTCELLIWGEYFRNKKDILYENLDPETCFLETLSSSVLWATSLKSKSKSLRRDLNLPHCQILGCIWRCGYKSPLLHYPPGFYRTLERIVQRLKFFIHRRTLSDLMIYLYNIGLEAKWLQITNTIVFKLNWFCLDTILNLLLNIISLHFTCSFMIKLLGEVHSQDGFPKHVV